MRRAALLLATSVALALASDTVLFDPEGNCHVRMRRMAPRTRRFVAPGAVWKIEVGFEVPWSTFEVWARIPIFYNLDELFSGRQIEPSAREIASLVAQEVSSSGAQSASTEALRQLASSSLRQQAAQGASLFFTGRAVAEDQYNIFQSLETAMAELGVDGKSCLLRTICELQESPVAEWTFVGELITYFLTPKEGDFSFMSDYQQARQLGAQPGGRDRCRPAYPECPLSVFNFIPDMLGEDALLPLGNISRTSG
ncbi:uncharacterized protein LOC119101906 [Pollicipes pollicipes]|uniref:uncharacterized protein LOC119101906 n=1 Tax=Pollicipes pollicipes TaxID=41117 RepID=UPI001884F1A0|nr:uncharacterized protein LOC119101906 [Pollicipes pollicipes]